MYEAVEQGKFINRGFLNGSYCPIYGFGVIIVILCLNPIKDNILILYFGSVILTSALEFLTGFILEKIFHQKWWDYSDSRFNLKGYICLKFSLLWGVACLIVVTIIHPLIELFVNWIPHTLGVVILIILFAGFF
ncbi:MAG: putative ABC transporter permease, partial [Ruminococcus sp.]|nr:putative ABC transporter permease [Ruminococcus sp.]